LAEVAATLPLRSRRKFLPRWIMAWPALAWWLFFFVIPLLWIFLYSFGAKPAADVSGPVSLETLSLENYAQALGDIFFRVFQITMRTAGVGTFLCAVVGFPVAYALAFHVPKHWRSLVVFLLILPYWTSFLLHAAIHRHYRPSASHSRHQRGRAAWHRL
jgi:spermidine/putrescine transport system permease protein